MNADAHRGVDADVSAGAKLGILIWVGVGLLVIGLLLAAGCAAVVLWVLRPRRGPGPPPAPAAGDGETASARPLTGTEPTRR
jgi:hypothetical protein